MENIWLKGLKIFERKKLLKLNKEPSNYNLILFGYNRIGHDLLQSFKKLNKRVLVVDYNPDTIAKLSEEGIDCRYGDADDEEFLNEFLYEGSQVKNIWIPYGE